MARTAARSSSMGLPCIEPEVSRTITMFIDERKPRRYRARVIDGRVERCDAEAHLGYAVHIRRISGRIELVEWTAFASAAPDLEERGAVESAGQDVPVYAWKDATFVWKNGEVVADRMSEEWRRKLGDIADRLNAQAIGDDGERYFADGRVDYGEGPESIQGVRTMAAFRYEPTRRHAKRNTRVVVLVVAALVVLAVAELFLALRSN